MKRRRARRSRGRSKSGRFPQFLLALVVLAVVAYVLSQRGTDNGDAAPGVTLAPQSSVAQLLSQLPIAPEANADTYDREAFGGWQSEGSCTTRERVLINSSRVPAVVQDDCTIVSGDWLSLYDGYQTDDPSELEVDHLVPLAEAWRSGAAQWPEDRRIAYANDQAPERPDALLAVTAATNVSKSDQDPAKWMPPNRDAWCRYSTAWVTQKAAWQLTVDAAEHQALTNILATCPVDIPTTTAPAA